MMMRVSFVSRRASPALAGVVERLWHVEAAGTLAGSETICPDGRPEIVLHLGDPMRHQPRHLIVGQMTAPLTIVPVGRVAMVGARLSPAGLHRLMRMPQDRLTDLVVPLDAVWSRWTRQTAEQVASHATPILRLAAFERALEALRSASGDPGDSGVESALHAWRAHRGNVPVARLAADIGISRRQFERRFRERVGLSPRIYARIVRFQAAFQALGHESGAAVAARCGYADQAHLVREVRRFGGQTPSALAAADGLTAFFRQ